METVISKQASTTANNLQNYLYSLIRTGHLKPGEKIQTAELAKEWNVSEGTVNQSLHVLAANGLVVRKRRAGTFVGNGIVSTRTVELKTNTLALILPQSSAPEFTCLTQALHSAVKDSVYNMVILAGEPADYSRFIHEQVESNVAGIILIPPLSGCIPVESLIELYDSKIPVVTCYRDLHGFGWPLVRPDIAYNTDIAARHLCQIGRRHIGFIAVESSLTYHGLLREAAFLRTMDDFGLSAPKDMRIVLPVKGTPEQLWLFSAIQQVENWLAANPQLDAICCMHDCAAWAIISALSKLGKKVPEDIAIIGNGDILDFFGFAKSDLTNIEMCYDKIVAAMLSIIQDLKEAKPVSPETLIKGNLIIRHSTVISE